MDLTNFTPPARRSMTDEEITKALESMQYGDSGVSTAMEFLEAQEKLREVENREFLAWKSQMERDGSQQAVIAVENARRALRGLPPVITHAEPAPPVVTAPPVPPVANLPSAPQVSESVSVHTSQEGSAEPTGKFEKLLTGEIAIATEEQITEDAFPSPVSVFDSLSASGAYSDDFNQEEVMERIQQESDERLGIRSRASSQFWIWLALGGSLLPLGLAWIVSKTGLAFSQGVAAIFLGALASGLVISFGAIAGKRSGLPTMLLSRAPFGIFANLAPATVMTIVRFFWSGAILFSILLIGKDMFKVQDLTEFSATNNIYFYIAMVAIFLTAVLFAIFGGRGLFRLQQISGLLGVIAVGVLIAMTFKDVQIQEMLQQPTGSWNEALGVAVLSFSVFGLVWTSASVDFARKLSPSVSAAGVVGWGTLSLVIVPSVVASYGLALFSSAKDSAAFSPNPDFAIGTIVGDLAALVTPWLAIGLLVSAVISLIVIMAMSLYSAKLSLHALGIKLRPAVAQPIIGLLIAGLAVAGLGYLKDPWTFLADYALIAAIPVAAWSGIFVSDVLIRRISYHDMSLSLSYGFYKSINWVNFLGWLVAIAVGFGFTYIEQTGFAWTGFIADLLKNQDFWATTSLGVGITFAFAFLLPVIFGIPRIKRQEYEILATESRRDDLKDVFGIID